MKHLIKIKLPACILIFIFTASACSYGAAVPNEKLSNGQENSRELNIENKLNNDLRDQLEKIASAAKGRIGVKALVLESGESVSLNSKEHFPMQSVYKLPIAMAVLHEADEGRIKLDQKIRVEKTDFIGLNQHSPLRDKNPDGAEVSVIELLRLAVSESDGTASDVLVKLAGGFQKIQSYLKEIKVDNVTVLNTEKEIGSDWETQYRNWATPDGAVGLLRAVYEKRGLSEQNNVLILKLLTGTSTGMKRLKGLLPQDTVVAHKTGTSNSKDGVTAATNDIGIITLPNGKHLAIAVFVSDSPADEKTREEVIAKIAKAVWDNWNK